jgi:ribosomal protein L13E
VSYNKTNASYTLVGVNDATGIDSGFSFAGWVKLGMDLRIIRALRIFVEDRAGKLDSHNINFPQAGVELWF